MRLLIYRNTFELLAPRLEPLTDVDPLIMEDDGSVVDARGDTVADPQPDIAFFSLELYDLETQPPMRDFARLVLSCGSVRWVHSFAAGYEHPMFVRMLDAGMRLSINDASAIAIAEFTMASVLSVFQPLAERRALQAERTWARPAFREIHGSHWLIVGFGAIGHAIARRAGAFGAQVVGMRRSAAPDPLAERVVTPAALHEELAMADVVVIAAAANADNEHLFDAAALGCMREDAVLVNISRGSLVDEAALLEALDAGRPGHAILDVFDTEPLPADDPLWAHPRVQLSAHCSAASGGTATRGLDVFMEHLQAWLQDAPLRLEVTGAADKG